MHDTSLQPVAPEQVARYYLSCELPNSIRKPHVRSDLTGKAFWRFVEALSYTYRANSVYHFLTDEGMSWYKATIPVERITLTGMSPQLNKLMKSPAIGRDPLKLRVYLRQYFAMHPHDDPDGLDECRPQTIPSNQQIIIVRENEQGNVLMLDGSHRLITQLLDDTKTTVETYYAKPNGKAHRVMIGDTSFLTLRRLYEVAITDNDRGAIISTVKQLARQSTTWRDSISLYWVAADSPEIAAVGRELLKAPDLL